MNRLPLSNISNCRKVKPRKVGQPRQCIRTGRWTKNERIAFLHAFRVYGKGKWKKIAEYITNRSTIQVKTHAQHVMRLFEVGQNPFKELDDFFAAESARSKSNLFYNYPQLNKKISPELNAAHALLELKKSNEN